MIDGVGIASAMVANKVPGIRAALCWDIFTANNAREHNNANVLVLGGRVIGDALAIEIVKKFLETDFAGGRHGRRVNKIMAIEARYLKR
jgi:ribose 5-phosphate isomerase B